MTPLGVPPLWSVVTTLAGITPALYLAYAQWRASGRVFQRIPYILVASVMGAGIVLTTVSSMLRVLYVRKFVFERTPKYGIAQSSDSWDGKRYVLGADAILGFEIGLVCYGMGSMAYAASLKNWPSFFFSSYFIVGLFFIIAVSLVQMSAPMLPRLVASVSSGNRES